MSNIITKSESGEITTKSYISCFLINLDILNSASSNLSEE